MNTRYDDETGNGILIGIPARCQSLPAPPPASTSWPTI